MKTDPTDTGGLFVGRRPGTRPIKYRALPQFADARRQAIDRGLAVGLLLLMAFVNLLFWGPFPVAWLWVGSQVDYLTGSTFLGMVVAFIGLLFTLMLALVLLRRIDHAWILVRRAGGRDQREGVIGVIFAITCGIGATVFTVWLLLFSGARLAPVGLEF
jgi:hypothetical protein